MAKKLTTEQTLQQTLQQAITAHQDGKLEDAEALYRSILEVHPHHPDANHNLGVLLAQLRLDQVHLLVLLLLLRIMAL